MHEKNHEPVVVPIACWFQDMLWTCGRSNSICNYIFCSFYI